MSELPVKTKKKARREDHLTVFLLSCGNRAAFRKRTEKGVLCGLWELPNVNGKLTRKEVLACLKGEGIQVKQITRSISSRHVFTHLEWRMDSWRIVCEGLAPQFRWADRETLAGEISLPSAWKPFLKELFRSDFADKAQNYHT